MDLLNKHSYQDERGFSLVEVMMAITILALVMMTVGTVLFTTVRVWSGQEGRVSVTQVGQLALERMVNHLRNAKAEGIVIEEDRIEFDGKNKDGVETRLAYELGSDGVLRFKQQDPDTSSWSGSPMIDNVTKLDFTDVDGDSAAPHSLIEISLQITGEQGTSQTIITQVAPRM